jgi:hypothetical protein
MAYVKLTCTTFNPQPKVKSVKKKKAPYRYQKKPTGEKALFQEIWDKRGPYSEIDNEFLGDINVCFFAHVIPKGQNKYPKFKLKPENIILMSFDQHHNWDNARHNCIGPQWDPIYALEESLKKEYKLLYS